MSFAELYDFAALTDSLNPEQHAQYDGRFCMIPKPFNRQHVRRQKIYDSLVDRLQASLSTCPTAVLCGPRGIGKSEIALDYAHSLWQSPDIKSIFWINAGTEQRFIDGFKNIASGAEIPGHWADVVDLLQLTKDWLDRGHKGKWLIIIDEVDDNHAYFEEDRLKGKTILDFIPRVSHGQILYITEYGETAMKLDPEWRPLHVPPMSICEAESLLDNLQMPVSTQAERLELITKLHGSPFAMTLAAAYMERQKISLSVYLRLLADPCASAAGFPEQADQCCHREARMERALYTCLRISYEAIDQESPKAAELLQIMSSMDYYSIPDCLTRHENATVADFDAAVGTLKAYALTTRIDRPHEPSFELGGMELDFRMSSTVQNASAAWVKQHIKTEYPAASKALTIVSASFPYCWPANTTICAKFLPHAKVLLEYPSEGSDSHVIGFRAELLRKVSSFYRNHDMSYEIAERLSLESKCLSEGLYGCNDTRTLDAYAEYSMIIQEKG